jgi:hypothetical protein
METRACSLLYSKNNLKVLLACYKYENMCSLSTMTIHRRSLRLTTYVVIVIMSTGVIVASCIVIAPTLFQIILLSQAILH